MKRLTAESAEKDLFCFSLRGLRVLGGEIWRGKPMRCGVLSLGVLLSVVLSVKAADPPAKDEEMAKVDRAVDKALVFLQKQQLADGAWSGANRNFGQGNPAITSLCVMAFLSAGNVPGEGRYGDTVEKGIQFVLKCQLPNGLIARGAAGNQEMYSHGICTLMLAEAAGMTDGKLGEEIRMKLVKAVHIILVAQRTQGDARGGWRYTVAHTDSDMSVTGWQIMALRAAKNVGCDVPSDNIDAAIVFIKHCQDPTSGGFCHQPYSNLSEPCTGTGILALELCGKEQHDSKEVIRAGDFLTNTPRAGTAAAPTSRSGPASATTGFITAPRRCSNSGTTTGTPSVAPARDAVLEPVRGRRFLADGERYRSRRRTELFHGHVRFGPDGGVSVSAHLPARRGTYGQIAAARRRVSLSILERRLPPRSQALLGNAGRRNSVSRPTPDRTRSRSSRGRAFPSRAWERGNGTGPNSGGTPPAADSFPIPLDSAPCRRISICRARPRWSPTAPDGWIRIRSKAWRSGQGSARTSPQPRRR